ncbi:MAG: RNA pyrophosphohydrolase [Deltaproteobacteria bacterium]|nr:RNA pyrophosphohydrolase [Deltaproteobacteria bacterium]
MSKDEFFQSFRANILTTVAIGADVVFVRLYTGEDGQSHFEDLDVNESAGLFSKVLAATAIVFKNDNPTHLLDWHPAPRRQYVITLSGAVDIRIGDGTVKTFGPGDVFLAEDVTGQGHTAAPKGNWIRAFVHIEQEKGPVSFAGQYFRAGVGAMIINREGLVLAVERADVPGTWQLPQGGLEKSEEPLAAVLREVAEETGILEGNLELLRALPEPLAYELPIGLQTAKTGRGQIQYWFLLRFHGSDSEIEVKKGGEARDWKWISFYTLLNSVVDFRKPVYRRLAEEFAPYLS